MDKFFVVTLSDLIGLGILAAFLISLAAFFGFLFILDSIDKIKARKKK